MEMLCGRFQYIFYFSQKRNYLYAWVFVTEVAGDSLFLAVPLIPSFFSAIVLKDIKKQKSVDIYFFKAFSLLN